MNSEDVLSDRPKQRYAYIWSECVWAREKTVRFNLLKNTQMLLRLIEKAENWPNQP